MIAAQTLVRWGRDIGQRRRHVSAKQPESQSLAWNHGMQKLYTLYDDDNCCTDTCEVGMTNTDRQQKTKKGNNRQKPSILS